MPARVRELVFEPGQPTTGNGLVDGPCRLSDSLNWPCDEESSPLFHLLSIPLFWLMPDLDSKSILDRWISVFISYDPTGYSHYGKMSSDDPDHRQATVILHDMKGPERSMHPNQSTLGKQVRIMPATRDSDDVASYIGSVPVWVQDPIFVEGFSWSMSIYGPDMDTSLGANRGIISGGVGYVFLKAEINTDLFGPVGKFFLQL